MLGTDYAKLGMATRAIEALEQTIRIDPEHATAHYNLGLSYLLTDNTIAALDQYRILKDLDTELAKKLFDLIYP